VSKDTTAGSHDSVSWASGRNRLQPLQTGRREAQMTPTANRQFTRHGWHSQEEPVHGKATARICV